MSEYKLIGLDMDGTLLNSKKKITPGKYGLQLRKHLVRARKLFYPQEDQWQN